MKEIDLKNYQAIPCISCNRCERVCPMNIGIPGSFAAMNHLTENGDIDSALKMERMLVTDKGKARAGECIVCGRCEKVCPIRIKIRDRLLDISKVLK